MRLPQRSAQGGGGRLPPRPGDPQLGDVTAVYFPLAPTPSGDPQPQPVPQALAERLGNQCSAMFNYSSACRVRP